ncbi:type II toxin-antitoxin system VapC family toxin [Nocardia lijiangensis]|uniref:type II toxin-antitoxin system VapC family toxin n=1 Tax=Nocardia lijiangensis TaxID=299618 RepID=UPI0008304DCA|nr:type II toxin-antitoxin system VapC family toxin [Nocardia lijiangensis]
MKGFLLDTCAVSEWVKPQPNPGLVQWLDEADEDRLHLSVITLGEIRKGVELLSDAGRKQRLVEWLTLSLIGRFERRLLPVDEAVAHAWGRMLARVKTEGRSVDATDALVAATAESHGLEVVTRNVRHFSATGVTVVCPWT